MTKRMSLKVSEDMYNWVSQQAETRGLTMNAVVVLALETYYMQASVMPNMNKLMELYDRVQEDEKKKGK